MNFFDGTPDSATAGSTFKIKVKDPNLAGQTVTVSITLSDGTPGNPATVDIPLNENGEGSHDYVADPDQAWLSLSSDATTDTHRVTIN